jgi:hypothetical protein
MTTRQVSAFAILFCMVSLTGCAQNRLVLNDMGSADVTDIAILRTEGNIYVFKIDGARPKQWTQDCTGTSSNGFTFPHFADDTCESVVSTVTKESIYELVPGIHTFTVYWATTHLDVSKASRVLDITFTAEKNKAYRLKSDGGIWTKIGSEIVFTVEEEGTKITTGKATGRIIYSDSQSYGGWVRQLEPRIPPGKSVRFIQDCKNDCKKMLDRGELRKGTTLDDCISALCK